MKAEVVAGNHKVGEAHDDRHLFGGDKGALLIIVLSHLFVFGLASSLFGFDLAVYVPTARIFATIVTFQSVQFLLALLVPTGITIRGQTQLGYHCNAYECFYITLALVALLHVTDVFDLRQLAREWPAYLTASVILGNLYSIYLHVRYSLYPRKGEENLKTNLFSPGDFFMGSVTVRACVRVGVVVAVAAVVVG
jgi:hypothetical protein